VNPLRLLAVIEAHTITGPAKNLLQFASMSAALGVEVSIATFVRDEGSNLFVDTARGAGIVVHTITERGPFDRSAMRTLGELVRSDAPDIVQTHAVKSHFLARLAGVPERRPWIAFHHGYTWPAFRARVYNELDRWSLRAATKVLTVSQPFARELESKGIRASRIEVIHNAIRPDWGKSNSSQSPARTALRVRYNIAADRKVILIVGRLSREKDHLTLLDAVHLLRSRYPVHLLIVGDGPERARIEEHIAGLNMANSVTLAGQTASAEPYYGIADLAVLSSRSEGSPNALLEAMAAGVPAVATAVGGIPEIATHEEHALLVRPGNTEELAAAFARLLTDHHLAGKLTCRAAELVRAHYTPEQRTRRLVEIYQGVRGGSF